ncbi:MAG: LegC family aminotransferase [Phycisphaeraceae bacterium]
MTVQSQSDTRFDTARLIESARQVVGGGSEFIPLHTPTIGGSAWTYVKECLDTGWVSSAGAYVTRFEEEAATFTGAKRAVAVVNGTAALHTALMLVGVEAGDEVIMPSLTFVATANATRYCGAVPHFVDIETRSLGLDPAKLAAHLDRIAERRGGGTVNRETGQRIGAVVPMHTFGHPVDLDALVEVCDRWGLPMVEDAAESLGSYYKGRHTGRFGRVGILSFNGNKVITAGAGGALITDDEQLAERAKHITTTAKRPHRWAYYHDVTGYNYRMPNLNAALGCAQFEQLPGLLEAKRKLADRYAEAFADVPGVSILREPAYARSNYWLNALLLGEGQADRRDEVLDALCGADLQVRPVWIPMHELPMYQQCPRMDLPVTESIARRVINLPSSADLAPSA